MRQKTPVCSEADAVRTAVSSPSLCTSATVATLQRLLGAPVRLQEGADQALPSATRTKTSASTASTTTAVTIRRAQTKATKQQASRPAAKKTSSRHAPPASVPIFADALPPHLSPQEKQQLATSVVNTTLKVLADTPRPQPALPRCAANPKSDAPATNVKRTRKAPSTRDSPSPRFQNVAPPLTELPNHSAPTRKTTPVVSNPASASPLGSIAECSCLSFAHLRKSSPDSAPTLQIMKGMGVLIGKLVIHGLDNLALKELRTFKRCLEQKAGSPQQPEATQDKETYASLLDVHLRQPSKDLVALLAQHQAHLLKLVALSGRPSMIVSAVSTLDPDHPSSPCAVVLEGLKHGEQQDKVVKQLESLGRTLLSMCPSPAPSADTAAADPKSHPSPDVVFRIQVYALLIQKQWWPLAGHNADVEKEVQEPLSRFLDAFKRRSDLSPKEKYTLARSLVSRLLPIDAPRSVVSSWSSAVFSVFNTLALLAQLYGQTAEALELVHAMAKTAAWSPNASILVASCHLRTLTLQVQDSNTSLCKSKDLLDHLRADSCHPLRPAQSAHNLAVEVVAARIAAVKALTTKYAAGNPTLHTEEESELMLLVGIVFLCTKLQLALLGAECSDKQEVNAGALSHLPEPLAAKTAGQCINSCLIACKLLLRVRTEADEIQSALADCCALANIVDDQGHNSPFVHISNVYWLLYTRLSTEGAKPAESSIALLRSSVEVLQRRSVLEQETGLLAVKLERLGAVLMTSAKPADAWGAFTQAVSTSLTSHIVDSLENIASTASLRSILRMPAGFQALLRNLQGLHRTALQQDRDICFYDERNLSSTGRAALLELQVYLFESSLQNKAAQAKIGLQLGLLYGLLLDIYSPTKHPLRRAYCYSSILRLSREYGQIIDQSSVEQAVKYTPSNSELFEDDSLVPLLPYYTASLKVAQALYEDDPSLTEISSAIALFQTVVEESETWCRLEGKVDDAGTLVAQLRTMETYLAFTAPESACLKILNLLTRIHAMEEPQNPAASLSTACQLAALHLRMGYSGLASTAIRQAEELSHREEIPIIEKISVLLVKGQIAIALKDLGSAIAAVASADTLLRTVKSGPDVNKLRVQQVRADRAFTCSLLHLHSGNVSAALVHGKHCALLTQATFKRLRQTLQPAKATEIASLSNIDGLEREVKGLSLSDEHVTQEVRANGIGSACGPDAWSLLLRLVRNMIHMYNLYVHSGRRVEAEYYLGQAKKVALFANSTPLRLQAHYLDVQHAYALGTLLPIADTEFVTNPASSEDSLQLAKLHFTLGNMYAGSRSWSKATASFEMAETITARMLGSPRPNETALVGSVPAKQILRGPIGRTKQTQPLRSKRTAVRNPAPTAKPKTKASQSGDGDHLPHDTSSSDEAVPIIEIRTAAMVQKAMALMCQGQRAKAAECLERVRMLYPSHAHNVMQRIADARLLLSKSSEEAAADFTFNVLPESTLSFPALSSAARRKSHNDGPRSSLLSPPSSRLQQSTSPRKGSGRSAASSFTISLSEAQCSILTLQTEGAQTASLPVCHQICELALKSTVLLSAIDTELPLPKLHPTRAAFSMELPRIESVRRDLRNVAVDVTQGVDTDFFSSPCCSEGTALTAAQFQQDYIDIIPEAWATVSLSMSEDCSELYIVRYEAGKAPFIVRLPMVKHKFQDMEDDESEDFDFEAGRTELSEIINLSNYSCHNSPDASVKGGALAWWAEREALDCRMQELLVNIESIWLGGFRGVLSQHGRDSSLLARFRKSFELILDRHLPSRQTTKALAKRLTLDSNVLQLFVGLGDDQEGSIDIDEALLDLLYFVIDVLQFNGERNAYDEVDFDSMATETLDALRAYHEAASNVSETGDRHLILVLDKRLHAFPWESMPCLEGTSVSRIGSMLTLRERILAMRRQQNAVDGERYMVPKCSGTYILNPGSDLKATEATMGPLLASVSDTKEAKWDAIANRAPTEDEFGKALSDSSMLLYFGHGNGSQYIRNRAIKKLEKCSDVVWLMGCSSGSVMENGGFEPTSAPLSYLVAGRALEPGKKSDDDEKQRDKEEEMRHEGERDGLCMAVVATLWDVTDKDIDRFSVKMGEEWGLWSSSAAGVSSQPMPKTPRKRGRSAPKTPSKTPAKNPSRSKSRPAAPGPDQKEEKKKSLVQAVVKGRGACHLKYLNGAAAVVYGVPVYLGE